MSIMIFGSYTSVERLEELRDCLLEEGYTTKLVKDVSDPPQDLDEPYERYILRKCYHWLEHSGANFLVFFRGMPNEGVSLELGNVSIEKLPWSTVFCDGGIDRFSTMLRGTVRGKIYHYDFATDRNLCERAKAAAQILFSKLGY